MKAKKIGAVLLSMLLACTIPGCRQEDKETETVAEETTDRSESQHASVSTVALTEGKFSEEKLDDTWDEKSAVYFTFENDKISIAEESSVKDKAEISGSTVVIRQEGTYAFSGTLEDGQIIVDADKEDTIRMVFCGVSISNSHTAPVYSKGGNVVITLKDGTENIVGDGEEYSFENEEEDEPEAAVFSKDDLTFNGNGTLSVTGNYKHGIQCKDDLKFVSGTYIVSAVNDGIVGKDSVSVRDGNFTIDSGDDGIKASNAKDTDKGYVLLENGSFQIHADGDGIQAETLLRINGGNFEITAGGGSQNATVVSGMPGRMPESGDEEMPHPEESGNGPGGESPGSGRPEGGMTPEGGTLPEGGMTPEGGTLSEGGMTPEGGTLPEGGMTPPESEMESLEGGRQEEGMTPPGYKSEENSEDSNHADGEDMSESDSTKCLKSYVELIVAGGEFILDSQDDGIHSNQNVTIQEGTITISTGDDGIHAEKTLTVNGGSLTIEKSYEGLEGFDIVIYDGSIKIVSSDDGINAAGDGDNDRESENQEESKNRSFMPDEDQGASMTINGGTIYVNANGDGLDANGNIFMNGGMVTVHGPSDGGNGTLDYASSCRITGGTFIGIGSIGMAQNPSGDSTQASAVFCTDSVIEAGTVISFKDKEGNIMAETVTEKNAQWFAFSSPELTVGDTYLFCAGTTEKEVILTQIVTQVSL